MRQHQNLPWQETSILVESGKTEGGVVFEQTGVVSCEGQELHCRRIVVQLEQPTRDGETQIALLTNLPETDAPSVLVAQLYRSRWKVETLFQVAQSTVKLRLWAIPEPRSFLFAWRWLLTIYFQLSRESWPVFMVVTVTTNCPITIWEKNSMPLIRE